MIEPVTIARPQAPTSSLTSSLDTPPYHSAPRHRTDSKVSFSSNNTCQSSRQEYMDSLIPPSHEEFEKISHVQQEKELELRRRSRELKRQSWQMHHQGSDNKAQQQPSSDAERRRSGDAAHRAATVIQRTYRGYRVRREMKGLGLNATTRWVTAVREAQFRDLTTPRARVTFENAAEGQDGSLLDRDENDGMSRSSTARANWKKAAIIARRAGHDDIDTSSSDSESGSSLSSSDLKAMSPEQRAAARKKRDEANARRKESSRMMGLQYFLEMVDLKHRYGSNLRIYHEEWKKSDSKENFFYWLDYGEGRNIEVEACPRDRLEREQVRYLSREERQYYLVKVDKEGRLCWAKNGERIDTTEAYKDSVHGIVPADDPTPAWSQSSQQPSSQHDDSSETSSIESALEADRAAKYADPEFDGAKGFKKVTHLSTTTIFNKLLRKSVKKNTWIFVADTSFRLYVGIKSSGAFQHSSFLQGSRISAAGLIKIKNGRLSSLSPLSGHYRPPASNFRAFEKSLKEAGVDTSHVSISKSYAVLVGLEVYVKTRRKGKAALKSLAHKKDKIVAPEEARKREEGEKDNSESAKREREVLAQEEKEREDNRAGVKLMKKLNIVPREPESQKGEVGKGPGEATAPNHTDGM